MTTYETLLIASSDFEKKDVTALTEKIEQVLGRSGAKLGKVTEWGRKRLAYEINKATEGFYILFEFEGGGDVVAKLGDFLKLQENVMRAMTTRKLS